MKLLNKMVSTAFFLGLIGCSRSEAEIAEAKFKSDSFICERYKLPKIVHESSPGQKSVYCSVLGVATEPETVLYLYSKN